MSVEDFIASRAVRPTPEKSATGTAEPAVTDVGQMILSVAKEIEKASPEIAGWLQGAAGAAGELSKIREILERIETLLTQRSV